MKITKNPTIVSDVLAIVLAALLLISALCGCTKPATADAIEARPAYCWSCEVTNYMTGVTHHADTCTVNSWAPQFKNADGNDDNRACILNR